MSFDFYDVVRVDGPLAPDEIRGKTGYLCGKSVDDDGQATRSPSGASSSTTSRVWCVDTGALVALGYRDDIARNREPPRRSARTQMARSWIRT